MFITALLLNSLAYADDIFQYATKAKSAYVYDISSDTVLLSKNPDKSFSPGSMSKLMTLYMAFEYMDRGLLHPDEKLPVSPHASSYGGSTMFLDTSDRVNVSDLLRGIAVLSGNDASAVLAETLSPTGTEAGFANLMTMRAKQLGIVPEFFIERYPLAR